MYIVPPRTGWTAATRRRPSGEQANRVTGAGPAIEESGGGATKGPALERARTVRVAKAAAALGTGGTGSSPLGKPGFGGTRRERSGGDAVGNRVSLGVQIVVV